MLGDTTMARAERDRQKLALFRRSSAAPRASTVESWLQRMRGLGRFRRTLHAIYHVCQLFKPLEHPIYHAAQHLRRSFRRVAHRQLGQREGAEPRDGIHPHGGIVEQRPKRQGPLDLPLEQGRDPGRWTMAASRSSRSFQLNEVCYILYFKKKRKNRCYYQYYI